MNLRFFLFSIVLMLGLPAWGGDLRVGGAVTTRADVERAEAILSGMNHLLGPAVTDCDACTIADAPVTTSDFLLYAARYLLGTSYVGGTLEAGDKEELRISLTQTDCILFVETCLDLARCKMLGYNDFSHFAEEVRQSRYRDGQIRGYGDRIHYTTEWIRRGEERGVVRDITLDLGGIPSDRKIFYMSRNYKKYKHLSSADTDPAVRRELDAVAAAEAELNRQPQTFIPTAQIPAAADKIRSGDIICFMSGVAGLDIAHVAVAYVRDGKVGFIHASQTGGKVMVDPLSIAAYAASRKNCPGIKVVRPSEKQH